MLIGNLSSRIDFRWLADDEMMRHIIVHVWKCLRFFFCTVVFFVRKDDVNMWPMQVNRSVRCPKNGDLLLLLFFYIDEFRESNK